MRTLILTVTLNPTLCYQIRSFLSFLKLLFQFWPSRGRKRVWGAHQRPLRPKGVTVRVLWIHNSSVCNHCSIKCSTFTWLNGLKLKWLLFIVTNLCQRPPSYKQHSMGSAPPHDKPDPDQSQSGKIRSAGKATCLQTFTVWPLLKYPNSFHRCAPDEVLLVWIDEK